VSSAPRLYVLATLAIAPAGHALTDKLSTPKPGSRSPGRDAMLELADTLARALGAWEADTVTAAGLTAVSASVRPGFRVQRAAATITANLPAAITGPYGVSHAGHLVDVVSRLTDRLQLAVLVHQLAAPCPHCHHRALVRRDGDDYVSCRMCRQTWPERHYAFLTRMVVADSTANADAPVSPSALES
jgi:hypothetical protein